MLASMGTPQQDVAPPESQQRQHKLRQFQGQCSQVLPGLFVSGEEVAGNLELLQAQGITHIVNCVGALCPNHFPEDFTYKTYFLLDANTQDISSVLFDALEFIHNARMQHEGSVLVHCSQGVSRSVALVCGYVMWLHGWDFQASLAWVKERRGVASPNLGFTCQLLEWHKRKTQGVQGCRLYAMTSHSEEHAPNLLMPKSVPPSRMELQPHAAYILQTPRVLFVWKGSKATADAMQAAVQAAGLMCKYEALGAPYIAPLSEGLEPAMLQAVVSCPATRNMRYAPITLDDHVFKWLEQATGLSLQKSKAELGLTVEDLQVEEVGQQQAAYLPRHAPVHMFLAALPVETMVCPDDV